MSKQYNGKKEIKLLLDEIEYLRSSDEECMSTDDAQENYDKNLKALKTIKKLLKKCDKTSETSETFKVGDVVVLTNDEEIGNDTAVGDFGVILKLYEHFADVDFPDGEQSVSFSNLKLYKRK